MNNIKELLVYGIGLLSQIFIIKYLFIKTIRLKSSQIKHLYDITIKINGFKFIFAESIIDKENESPIEFSGLFKLKANPPFYFSCGERLLTAGYRSKEDFGSISYFKWNDKKIKELINKAKNIAVDYIYIYISEGSDCSYLGRIMRSNKDNEIKMRSIASSLENDIIRMEAGELNKTSALLYGEPGNGKTTIIRELAKKYGYNIFFVSFNKEISNREILKGLSYVDDKTFVIFEDFDSVFNKREVLNFEKPNFTFDAILNSLDGIYNNYNKIAFFMTANDINKIDDSIKNRPSRMKHKIIFSNPTKEEIIDILQDEYLSILCVGLNMDEVFLVKDLSERHDYEYVVNYINKIKEDKLI
jgi:Cdc6-like AAA superfamily ATPase